ncbi:MAG: lysophospholipid acyltransferase family protein, partial [Candidatus Nealsonbacteria bacterium]|nr:lysophospholipid acyltransferase family protein [Candidatus Nealsonbacteria bacterium]
EGLEEKDTLEIVEVNEAELKENAEPQIENARKRIRKIEREELNESVEESEEKPEKGTPGMVEKPKEKAGFIKRIGRRIGETIGSRTINSLRDKVNKFEIDYSGADVLKELKGKPYILAANHIKPENRLAQSLGMAPDAFLLERTIAEKTQGRLNIIANPGSRTSKIPILKYIERFWSPLREAAMEGMGFIPVRRKKGSFNKNFIKLVEEAIKRNEPILIFPERHWYKDFDESHEFSEGAAFLAKKFNLPIVPAYIDGARSWSGKKAEISIGQPITTEEKIREAITEEIKKGIGSLKDNIDGSSR